FLFGTGAARFCKPLAQVHLPGDERDQRDAPVPDRGFHQFGEFLGFSAEECRVVDGECEPQHEFVQERSEEHTSELYSRFDLVCRRPSHPTRRSYDLSCTAPVLPASANHWRRSICRAMNEISGMRRCPIEDSTSLVSFWDSLRKNAASLTANASHSTSSSRNSTTAS